MAPGTADSDFGQQGWIDTLGLKQIFSIFSVLYSHCYNNIKNKSKTAERAKHNKYSVKITDVIDAL